MWKLKRGLLHFISPRRKVVSGVRVSHGLHAASRTNERKRTEDVSRRRVVEAKKAGAARLAKLANAGSVGCAQYVVQPMTSCFFPLTKRERDLGDISRWGIVVETVAGCEIKWARVLWFSLAGV